MKLLFVVLLVLAVGLPTHAAVPQKKFKRALILSGGGITPGVSIGIINGAEAAGFQPDVIIAVCGSSMGAAIANSFRNPDSRIDFARSPRFHDFLMNVVRIETPFALTMMSKFNEAEANPGILPQLFSGNVLSVPERVGRILPREKFSTAEGSPRIVILAARARFGASDAGMAMTGQSLFRTVFFTDPDTATVLRGVRSPIRAQFPESFIDPRTSVVTTATTIEASRASISDPFLMNPGRVGQAYYFTGAVDLYPIEVAQQIAEEILVAFPSGEYTQYERVAIRSAYGFDPKDRAKRVAQSTNVKWIDVSGLSTISFDPIPRGLAIVSQIPESHAEFSSRVYNQYSFGYWRAVEAVKQRRNSRAHLRVRSN